MSKKISAYLLILYQALAIQFWMIFYTLKGWIILGFFPSLISSYHLLDRLMQEPPTDPLDVGVLFKDHYLRHWKRANQVGWISLVFGALLFLDYQIVTHSMQVPGFTYLLRAVSFLFLATLAYLPLLLIRYQLSLLQYFQQAFLMAVAFLPQSIALLMACWLIERFILSIPGLSFFIGIPLTAYPILFFTRQALARYEDSKK